jgi:ribosomal protein S14
MLSSMSARCQLTGRKPGFGHAISHSHRRAIVSRVRLREMAHAGQLPGVTKSSW